MATQQVVAGASVDARLVLQREKKKDRHECSTFKTEQTSERSHNLKLTVRKSS